MVHFGAPLYLRYPVIRGSGHVALALCLSGFEVVCGRAGTLHGAGGLCIALTAGSTLRCLSAAWE